MNRDRAPNTGASGCSGQTGVDREFAIDRIDGAFASSVDLGALIVRSMKDGFSLLDLQGNHVYVNPALCAMTGFSREELLGVGAPHPYWPPEEISRIQDALAETLRGIYRDHDLVFVRRDGVRFPVTVSPFPVKDVGGRVVGYSALVKDVTERRRAEAELLETHQKMRLHVEKTPMAVIEWDLGFRVTQWNPAAESIFGYTRAEALGRHASFIIPEQSRHLVDVVWSELVRKAGGERATNENVRKDGSLILCEWYNTPLVDERGVVQAVASLAMDVTDRLRAEAAQRALTRNLEQRVAERTKELESAFAELLRRNAQLRAMAVKLAEAETTERRRIARLMHDGYQQLLVAAKIKTEMLQSQLPDDATRATSRQVQQIINQAIEASRSLTMELAPPILLDAGLDASLPWLTRWMEEHHGLRVALHVALPETPVTVDLNTLVFNAARELLFNVAKHAGVREARVTLAPDGDGLRLVVQDEGAGFDPELAHDQPQTFGLFHIRERVALVDGRLDFESTPGKGTSVTLCIPLPAGAPTMEGVPETYGGGDAAPPVVRSDRRIRLMVADDHSVVRQGLVQVLAREKDIEIVGEAIHGQDAVDKARALQPSVVLMDVTMPKLNGLEATRIIATRYPGIRVIGLSMHDQDDMRDSMLAAGAVDYLSKNRPVEDLLAAIRRSITPRDRAD